MSGFAWSKGGGGGSGGSGGGRNYRNLPPPAQLTSNSQGRPAMKKTASSSYFDDDDEEDNAYQYSSRSSSMGDVSSMPKSLTVEDEEDPLEQFMASVGNQMKQEQSSEKKETILPEIISGQDEDYESYYDYPNQNEARTGDSSGDDMEYDSEGNPSGRKATAKKSIEPMKTVNHEDIHYKSFKKNFYRLHEDIARLSVADIHKLREDNEIHVQGNIIPSPIQSFMHAGFDAKLLREIVRVGYEAPTAIQMQALPVVLSGRDLIGLAKTGSGKTLSFVWPMIVHIMDQPQMKLGDGPIGLILAPTRELAAQIYSEACKFCKPFNIRVCAIYGGEGKYEMSKALKEAPEIVVATPGRFIDLANAKATNLMRCTMIVLDEADRMFDMGFEYQMRSIVNNVRRDRQTLLFSATMKKKIEGFAREILNDPIRIIIGSIGQSNPDIRQVVDVVPDADRKWPWLTTRIDDWIKEGKVLIFAGSKVDTETLSNNLKTYFNYRHLDTGIECLHGDKDQSERSIILNKFRTGKLTILVATDVASRGLDIKDVRTVINYDAARNIETHVHRIGRTGRMGIDGVVPGTAYTVLVSSNSPCADTSLAVDLIKNLRDAGQEASITEALIKLAEVDPRFQRHRGVLQNRSGERRGIGTGITPAMTSEMLAAATSETVNRNNDHKHEIIDRQGSSKAQQSRISRFQPAERSSVMNISMNKSAYSNASNNLPGFVRSSQTLSSVSEQDVMQEHHVSSYVSSDNQSKKRSRWDT